MEKIIHDTIYVVKDLLIKTQSVSNSSSLDETYKIAMICIACFNLVFAVYIFVVKNKKDHNTNEKNRRINLLKTLILDNNLKYLYQYFEEIDNETIKLKVANLTIADKRAINDAILEKGKFFRFKFIDSLNAIDNLMYRGFISKIDNLQDGFTESIFDPGINLSHKPMFEEKITKNIVETKTFLIKLLFEYTGEQSPVHHIGSN